MAICSYEPVSSGCKIQSTWEILFKDGLSFKMGEGKGMILWTFPLSSEGFPSDLSLP